MRPKNSTKNQHFLSQTEQRLNSRNQYEGTGIGLALCKKIVAAHGGMIYATALPMAGATFHILLPIKHA